MENPSTLLNYSFNKQKNRKHLYSLNNDVSLIQNILGGLNKSQDNLNLETNNLKHRRKFKKHKKNKIIKANNEIEKCKELQKHKNAQMISENNNPIKSSDSFFPEINKTNNPKNENSQNQQKSFLIEKDYLPYRKLKISNIVLKFRNLLNFNFKVIYNRKCFINLQTLELEGFMKKEHKINFIENLHILNEKNLLQKFLFFNTISAFDEKDEHYQEKKLTRILSIENIGTQFLFIKNKYFQKKNLILFHKESFPSNLDFRCKNDFYILKIEEKLLTKNAFDEENHQSIITKENTDLYSNIKDGKDGYLNINHQIFENKNYNNKNSYLNSLKINFNQNDQIKNFKNSIKPSSNASQEYYPRLDKNKKFCYKYIKRYFYNIDSNLKQRKLRKLERIKNADSNANANNIACGNSALKLLSSPSTNTSSELNLKNNLICENKIFNYFSLYENFCMKNNNNFNNHDHFSKNKHNNFINEEKNESKETKHFNKKYQIYKKNLLEENCEINISQENQVQVPLCLNGKIKINLETFEIFNEMKNFKNITSSENILLNKNFDSNNTRNAILQEEEENYNINEIPKFVNFWNRDKNYITTEKKNSMEIDEQNSNGKKIDLEKSEEENIKMSFRDNNNNDKTEVIFDNKNNFVNLNKCANCFSEENNLFVNFANVRICRKCFIKAKNSLEGFLKK